MPRDDAKGLKAALSRENLKFNLSMGICILVGVLLLFVAVTWKHEYNESGEKLLILQIGESLPLVIPADGSRSSSVLAGVPAEPLEDQIAELITETDQACVLADILRDLRIAVLISVFVTISLDLHTSTRLPQ